MTLQRLKWLAVLAPLLFLAAIEAVRQTIAPELFRGWPGSLLLGGVVLLATFFFAETIFGLVNRLQEQLAQQNRELVALQRQIQALAVTEERERIAREMHDSLAQVLGYVNTKAQATEALLESGQTEKAAAQLGQLSEAARAAYADVREGILGLRASPGEARTFVETLRDYLEQWQGQSGVAVALSIDPAEDFAPRLTPHGEVQLLRIIQEALANVRKHAGATRAEIRLLVSDGCLETSINDDGSGFDPDALERTALPRFGLATMRERAEAIGGTLTVASTPGGGTSVTASVPVGEGDISSARCDR
jgi:signal transduction histidine kinase